MSLFTQAYRYAAEPFFFRHAGEKDAMRTQAEATKWFTITSAAGMLFILLFIDIVKYFISPKYWSGLPVVPVLLMANLLLGVYYNFSIWYRLKDRTGLGAWISVVSALLTIGLNFVLIPLFGYQGASWVTLICYAYLCFATWYTGKKHYPVPYAMGRMSAYVALVFALWGLDQLLQPFLAGIPLLLWGAKVILFGAFAGVVFQFELRNKIFKSA
jgi:O-antigen/teichoic acid export membrane protein